MTDHNRLYRIHCQHKSDRFYTSASGPLLCNLKCPFRAVDRYSDGQEKMD